MSACVKVGWLYLNQSLIFTKLFPPFVDLWIFKTPTNKRFSSKLDTPKAKSNHAWELSKISSDSKVFANVVPLLIDL